MQIGTLQYSLGIDFSKLTVGLAEAEELLKKSDGLIAKSNQKLVELQLKKIAAVSKEEIAAINKEIDQTTNQLKRLQGVGVQLKKTTEDISGLKGIFADIKNQIVGAFAVYQVAAFGKELFAATNNAQQFRIAMETLLQSKTKADRLITDIVNYAKETPFTLQQTQDVARQMVAFGYSAEAVIPKMRQLGDIAAGTGTPLNELAATFLRIKTQGRLMGDEANRLAEKGIPIYQLLAEKTGKSAEAIRKMGEAGLITFKDVDSIITSMAASGGKFFGLMANQMETLGGQASNLEDNLYQLKVQIGTALIPVFETLIAIAQELVGNFGAVTASVAAAGTVWGTYKLYVQTAELWTSKLTLAHKIENAYLVIKHNLINAINKAWSASPWGFIVAGVMAAVGAFFAFRKSQENINVNLKKANEDIFIQQGRMSQLFNVLRKNEVGTNEYKLAVKKLVEVYGEYNPALATELQNKQNLDAVQKRLNDSVIMSIALKAKEEDTTKAINESVKTQKEVIKELIETISKKIGIEKATDIGLFLQEIVNKSKNAEEAVRLLRDRFPELEKVKLSNIEQAFQNAAVTSGAFGQSVVQNTIVIDPLINSFKRLFDVNNKQKASLKEIDDFYKILTGSIKGFSGATNETTTKDLTNLQKAEKIYKTSRTTIQEYTEALDALKKIQLESNVKTELPKVNKYIEELERQKKALEDVGKTQKNLIVTDVTELEKLRIEAMQDGIEKRLKLLDFEHNETIKKLKANGIDIKNTENEYQKQRANVQMDYINNETKRLRALRNAAKQISLDSKTEQINLEEEKTKRLSGFFELEEFLRKKGITGLISVESQKKAIELQFDTERTQARINSGIVTNETEKQILQQRVLNNETELAKLVNAEINLANKTNDYRQMGMEFAMKYAQSIEQMNVDTIKSLEDFGAAVGNLIREQISAYIAEGIAYVVRSSLIYYGKFSPLVAIPLAAVAGLGAKALFENAIPKFAEGTQGYIVPNGYNNDKYPAMLSSKEMVLNSDQQARILFEIANGKNGPGNTINNYNNEFSKKIWSELQLQTELLQRQKTAVYDSHRDRIIIETPNGTQTKYLK